MRNLILAVLVSTCSLFADKVDNLAATLRTLQTQSQFDNDPLIIGYTDPDEKYVIDQDTELNRDIQIMNRGQLLIRDCHVKFDGEIFIMNDGEMHCEHATFEIVQSYAYEHQLFVIENGLFRMENVQFESTTHSWSISMIGKAKMKLDHVEVSNGFITTTLMEESTAEINDCETPGEYLCFGENNINFQNSDFLIFWYVLPKGSQVDIELPADSLVIGWSFSNESSGVSDLDYSVEIDSCTNVMWGIISESGSDAVFRNTDFRIAGLMFDSDDSVKVENLTNGAFMANNKIDLSDRRLEFENTKVQTWNFYATNDAKLDIDNCIFGEVLGMGASEIKVLNSICDGSGGYIGAMDSSTVFILSSFVRSQVIARQDAVLIAAASTLSGWEIAADENAIMFLADNFQNAEPAAYHSASVFEANVPFFEAPVDDVVPVYGTARLLTGPESPLQMEGYSVKFREDDDSPWMATDGYHAGMVYDNHLADWNTHGLQPDYWQLGLTLYHNFADSIDMVSVAELLQKSIVETSLPNKIELMQNFPNPFNSQTTIIYEIESAGHVQIDLYNTCGQWVRSLLNVHQTAGRYKINIDGDDLAGGLYYYRLKHANKMFTRQMLLVR